ncbi:cell division topological specificity factor mine, putative [Heliomicrobium modesticaldum Ice1]|uniref:Cell division topological specificity factor n=1 Tax=Heliobacterium modesticaldum (strain ATCC 51547 / Ice1) TaxID=498761 RepID=MINE_HELMI|nr:cell division topological specificity factor MinE [Heliomicrobium modesticaldum]B0TBY0.1 RecName: Full=Cell division topological specificity factor [Heliomicrobium modesticaldum Ice1]ABZ85253.1 cell division topological specificity factor mine, putative [Heliomicrobium modesticaldum Ice1]
MLDFLNRMFSRDGGNSKNIAKERLRLVLVHDRSSVSPEIVEALKEDLIKVISSYMEIDERSLEVNLNNDEASVALVANIPVLGLKRRNV